MADSGVFRIEWFVELQPVKAVRCQKDDIEATVLQLAKDANCHAGDTMFGIMLQWDTGNQWLVTCFHEKIEYRPIGQPMVTIE